MIIERNEPNQSPAPARGQIEMSGRLVSSLKCQLRSGGIESRNLSQLFSRMKTNAVKIPICAFSSKDGSKSNSKANANANSSTNDGSKDTEDPFGVNFQDGDGGQGLGNIGPKDSLPPNYIRDSATGKLTGEIQMDASLQDKKLLNLGPTAQRELLHEKLDQEISKTTVLDKSEKEYSMANVARRIREEQTAFTTIGRKVNDIIAAQDDSNKSSTNSNSNENAPSAPLTQDEVDSLHKFMEKTAPTESTQHLMSQTQHLIPTIGRQSSTKTPSSATTNENPDLDLEWMTASAQRTMADTDLDEEDLEDPFANLMPSDLNPAKKVNRRNAKPIPKQLLHHNNLSLLRRYVTPGGQIMNRIQSRLGAKDQRKVAKLVKRARHLGLIPVLGQWKFEDKGNVKDPSLWEYKDWEKRLVERGLVERKSSIWDKKQNSKAVSVGDSSTTVGVTNGW